MHVLPIIVKTVEAPEQSESAQILVIDDDPQLSNILQRILVVLGHSVVRAGSGAEGIEHLQSVKPGFDMVFTDLSMPEMSGYEVAKAVKAFDQRIVVAFITGWGNDLDRDNLESRGVDLLIAKPYRIEEVRELVKNALEIRQKLLLR
jgi:CheY-like chemotaxis protein